MTAPVIMFLMRVRMKAWPLPGAVDEHLEAFFDV
jgi:hypothetical protein